MALQFDAATRNAMGNAIEATVGTAPILRHRTGAPPANVAAASTGTVITEMTLPSDWYAAFAAGAGDKVGTWEDNLANATGTIGHFEIVSSDGTTRRMQGTVTATGGGGDMTVDNINVNINQKVTVTGFTLTMGNA